MKEIKVTFCSGSDGASYCMRCMNQWQKVVSEETDGYDIGECFVHKGGFCNKYQLREVSEFKVGDRVRVKNNVSRRTLGSEKTSHKLDGIEDKVRTVSDDAITFEYDWNGEKYFTTIFPDQLEKVEARISIDAKVLDSMKQFSDAVIVDVLKNTERLILGERIAKEAKPMKQIRVTECSGSCKSLAKKLCFSVWQNVFNETKERISFNHPPEIKGRDELCSWCSVLKHPQTGPKVFRYELRDAPDSTLDREEVSEVENEIGLYHVVAWLLDDAGKRESMEYHGWIEAMNNGNAKVKAMMAVGWKGSKNPDDYSWTIALTS